MGAGRLRLERGGAVSRNLTAAKDAALAAMALLGSAVANTMGGWDAALRTLILCMVLDYLTGMIVAGVFKRSGKSSDGSMDSRAGFQGLCKKGAELVLVLIGNQVDLMLGESLTRTAVIFFLIGNEGLSVMENLGLMGVPYPPFLKEMLAVLKKQGEQKEIK